jgi:hypothetical protein
MATQAHVLRVPSISLIRSSLVGVLALVLPVLVSAQGQSPPALSWPSPAAAAVRSGLDSIGAAAVAGATGVGELKTEQQSCGPDSHQVGSPSESGLTVRPFGGEGADGSGNPSSPALSTVTSGGPGGIGIEYLSPNDGVGVSEQRTADIYQFNRAGFHHAECNLPSSEDVRPDQGR